MGNQFIGQSGLKDILNTGAGIAVPCKAKYSEISCPILKEFLECNECATIFDLEEEDTKFRHLEVAQRCANHTRQCF